MAEGASDARDQALAPVRRARRSHGRRPCRCRFCRDWGKATAETTPVDGTPAHWWQLAARTATNLPPSCGVVRIVIFSVRFRGLGANANRANRQALTLRVRAEVGWWCASTDKSWPARRATGGTRSATAH